MCQYVNMSMCQCITDTIRGFYFDGVTICRQSQGSININDEWETNKCCATSRRLDFVGGHYTSVLAFITLYNYQLIIETNKQTTKQK